MYPVLTQCPVCSQPLTVTRLSCSHCGTQIEGSFMPGQHPLAALNPEQLQFLLTFLRCEGRFKRMEEEMKLSYPTLRNRFNEILRTLGFEPLKDETPAPQPASGVSAPVLPAAEERRKILRDLEEGKITALDASLLLRGMRPETGER